MSQIFPETVAMVQQMQQEWVAQMKERGLPIPKYTDWEDGLPNGKPTEPTAFPPMRGADGSVAPIPVPTANDAAKAPAKPRKEGALKGTSKAEVAREIMRNTKDKGVPLDTVIQMIMDATGHDKALAKATYKANAGRVGIVL